MGAVDLEQWKDFFVAVAGAAAALAGLLIVAISVNIERILEYKQLPPRAGAAVASLMLALLASIAGLAHQPLPAFAIELIVLGAISWYLHQQSIRAAFVAAREFHRPARESVTRVVTAQLQTLPFIVAGALLLAGVPAGLFVLLGGVFCAFIFAMGEAWVLLVEILR